MKKSSQTRIISPDAVKSQLKPSKHVRQSEEELTIAQTALNVVSDELQSGAVHSLHTETTPRALAECYEPVFERLCRRSEPAFGLEGMRLRVNAFVV